MKMRMIAAAVLMLAGCAQTAPPVSRGGGLQVEVSLQALTAPSLRVTIPDRGAQGDMTVIGRNGDVVTWAAGDAVSLALRRGVVVSSSGLGHDLMGADAAATLAALDGFAPAEYRRKMRYLTGDNLSVWLTAGCSMALADASGGLRHFKESCKARDISFANQYWLNGSGQMLRSRQWVSPQVGHVETELRNP